MTDKPNSPIRRVCVSNAPPPIIPIRVGRYTAPNAPPVPPPNWDKWGHMRDVELWEAVALSLNLEPDKLPVYLGAFERFGDDPFRICPQTFLDRLQVANSNCGISLGFRPVHKLKARCLVDLPAFGVWAAKLNIPNMPPELVAMAETMRVVPTEPQTITPSPAPVVAAGASGGVEPDKAVPLPLTTGDIAFCFAGLRWNEQEWKKPLGDKPKWLEHCIAIPGVRGVSQRRWNPVLIGAALEREGLAGQNSIRARFQTKPQLAPWRDAWKTYEADNFDTE